MGNHQQPAPSITQKQRDTLSTTSTKPILPPPVSNPLKPPVAASSPIAAIKSGPSKITTEAQVFEDGSAELIVTVPSHIVTRLLQRAQKQDLGEFLNAEVLKRSIEGYVY